MSAFWRFALVSAPPVHVSSWHTAGIFGTAAKLSVVGGITYHLSRAVSAPRGGFLGRGCRPVLGHPTQGIESVCAHVSLSNRSRMGHGMFEALDCPGSKADELGGLEYACTLGEFAACGLE